MAIGMGCWTSGSDKRYPVDLAAKLVKDCKSLTQDEASLFVVTTKDINQAYCDLLAKHGELQRQLAVSEQTVRLLQVEAND